MGLFKSIFRGSKGFSAATNALLAEYVLPKLNEATKSEVRFQIIFIMRAGGFPNLTEESIKRRFDKSPREIQLNLIALALNDLGIEPGLQNEFWHEIRNPFLPNLYNDDEVAAVQLRLANQHKIHFQVSRVPMLFDRFI